ncbi:MAG: ABC transporter permease, partial [Hyphomicrobiaceae bacterium]|nr:ABC transporter permease [Hyphomicrobiaceae bacterium]
MTAAASLARAAPARTGALPLVFALALRELRNGVKGFYVFIACVALGVAAITAVGALADAMRASFAAQGEVLLGGDVTLARPHKPAEATERAWLAKQGALSEVATLRAMGRRPDGSDQALIELRGVDAAYPLVGTVALAGGLSLADALRQQPGAAVDPILLERLSLKVGDLLSIGRIEVPIRATIEAEPDKLPGRFSMGPRVLVSLETLRHSGLIEPGSLVTWRYAVKLADNAGATEAGLVAFREAAKQTLPEGGFSYRDRRDPTPQISRTLDRLRQFLTLVGLTALLVGGVGIANAVTTFVDRRRTVIATFRSLGATTRTIFGVHLLQVLIFSAIGIAIGMGLGLMVPVALARLLGDALPIKVEFAATWRSLATAAAYGLLVVLIFTLWPLGRTGQMRAGVLFRDEVAPERRLPGPGIATTMLAAALALAGLAILTSEAPH